MLLFVTCNNRDVIFRRIIELTSCSFCVEHPVPQLKSCKSGQAFRVGPNRFELIKSSTKND